MYGQSYFNYVRDRELGITPHHVPIVRRRARPEHVTSRVVRVLRRRGRAARQRVGDRDRVQIARRAYVRRVRPGIGLHMPYANDPLPDYVYE